MPTPQQILETLSSISNNYYAVAIFWHVVIYFLLVMLAMRWRPDNRHMIYTMALMMLSVAMPAWVSANLFNGILFTIAAILVVVAGFKATKEPVTVSSLPWLIAGIALLAYGLWYPHFLKTGSPLIYFMAAPAGLIPCPTLSVVIAFALIFQGFRSKFMAITLICFGFFYALFGILKLGVYLDLGLLAGTALLLVQMIIKKSP